MKTIVAATIIVFACVSTHATGAWFVLKNAEAQIPDSINLYREIERTPSMRMPFYESETPRHPMAGPIYTSQCDGSGTGEYVAYGCLDVCAALRHARQAETDDYLHPIPAAKGKPEFRLEWQLYPGYVVPLYFSSQETMDECNGKIQSGQIIVAYGGWCTAGIEDENVHWSSPNKSLYKASRWENTWILWITNMAKGHVKHDPELQANAEDYFKAMLEGADAELDIRGRYVPPFLDDHSDYQPPRRGIDFGEGATTPRVNTFTVR